MPTGFDWAILEKVGMGGVTLVLIFCGYKAFMFMLQQWKSSTEALDRNSEAYQKLSNVFERANERELEFQREAMRVMKDTNSKVTDIHDKVQRK